MDLWSKEKSTDSAAWEAVLDRYYDIVENIGKDKLPELERWFQEKLPELIKKEGKLSNTDVVRLVEWKVGKRGKFRPNLLKYAKELTLEAVEDASSQTFKVLSKYGEGSEVPTSALKEALAPLTKLRGIGPATASAVLSAAHPSIPFMSDEAMAVVIKGKPRYDVNEAVELTEVLQKKAKELSAAGGRKWTARSVEQCLFAATKDAQSEDSAPKKRKR